MTTIPVKLSEVKDIIRAAFPEWKGRKVKLELATSVTLHDLNFDGGTRNEYVAVHLSTRCALRSRSNAFPAWDNPHEGQVVPIPEGVVVVQHSMFCGRDVGCRIWARADSMAKFLPVAS